MFNFLLNFSEDYIPRWYSLLYCAIVFFVCGSTMLYLWRNRNRQLKTNSVWAVVFLIFFILFAIGYCIGTDYFNYRRWVTFATQWVEGETGAKRFFSWLAYWCNGNYELFRLMVWGGALVLVYASSRLFRVSSLLSLLLLFVFFYSYFCYARASLAMSVFFFGIAVWSSSQRGAWLQKILGIVITISSIYIHNEMIVPLLCTPVMFVKFSGRRSVAYLLLFLVVGIVLIYAMRLNLNIVGQYYVDKVSGYEDQMQWNEMKWQEVNWRGRMKQYMGYLMFYIPFFIIFAKVSPANNYQSLPRPIHKLYNITLGIMLISTAIYIFYGGITVFFYRTLLTAQIPMAILMAYMFEHQYIKVRTINYLVIYAILLETMHLINVLHH